MNESPSNELEYGKSYQLEIYFPDTNFITRAWYKSRSMSGLEKLDIFYKWKFELEETDFLVYSLKVESSSVTHNDIFTAVQNVYDGVMWISCKEIETEEEVKPIFDLAGWWSENWEWFAGFALLPSIIAKKEDIAEWWDEHGLKVLTSIGFVILLIYLAYAFIKKPVVVIKK